MMKLDSVTLKAFPTPEWIQTLLRELKEFLSHHLQPTQEWRHLLGCMSHQTQCARLGYV